MGVKWRYFYEKNDEEGRKEMFYLTTHSAHFIYGYMASDIWLRTILIVRKETRCRHIDYSLRLAARVLLYAPSHRQDSTYHGLCYTSRGALAGTRNSSMCSPHEGSIRWPIAPWALTTELHLAPSKYNKAQNNTYGDKIGIREYIGFGSGSKLWLGLRSGLGLRCRVRIVFRVSWIFPVSIQWRYTAETHQGARCSSVVRVSVHGTMVVRSIPHGGPIELFLIPASAPQLVSVGWCI